MKADRLGKINVKKCNLDSNLREKTVRKHSWNTVQFAK